jgi:hypothetical protein
VRSRLLVLAVLLAAACSGTSGSTPAAPSPAVSSPAAVTHPTLWLCRPGLADNPCAGDLSATAVSASGATSVQSAPARSAPVDCFYVYPTVSDAATTNAPLRRTAVLDRTASAQVARFSSVCDVYAPVYRQLTVHALLTGRFGDRGARALAHADVVSAWHDYLRTHPGRRFVLIGHSQGSFELLQLLQEEVDGTPALRSRLVSALLLGGNVKVPPGKDVGGDLQQIPLCRSTTQTRCLVTYNSYGTTPPADALFGRPDPARHLVAACSNPAALAGGSGVLSPYLPSMGRYPTAFVTYPGYLTATCRTHDGSAWLQVAYRRVPGDRRPVVPLTLGAAWGLHQVDVNLALGDLVDLVRSEARS